MTALMTDFSVTRPHTLADAIAARRDHAAAAFIAGGTDLVVNMRHGIRRPALLIDLSGVAELAGIETAPDGMRIGAGVTIATLASSPVIVAHYGAVAQAAAAIAGPAHRTMGTVGGNLCLDTRCVYYNQSEWWRRSNSYCLKHRGEICHVAPQGQRCHAAFTGDLAPALLALDAQVEIAGSQGRRRIPLADLYAEDGRAHLRLGADEILIAVHLPSDPPRSAYAKVRTRGAIDYPLAGVAVALAAQGGVLTRLRIGVTGTNSRPFVVADTAPLQGKTIDDQTLQQIDRLVQKQVQPMRTTIASAHYRRLAAAALARRLVAQLARAD
ncbi:MAG TPA: 4-hydroxybenzoyl-CoA reductase subunit beta [Xanthobacteraceae bacterium]|nr:4-hydroxybenzoyl-CoA reductase subunit beta [Xanthobacteraceae bacterium]